MTELEQLRAIAVQAAKVRDAQRLYFKNRGPAELMESKALERELDRLIGDLKDRRREQENTPSMFSEEPKP